MFCHFTVIPLPTPSLQCSSAHSVHLHWPQTVLVILYLFSQLHSTDLYSASSQTYCGMKPTSGKYPNLLPSISYS
jgi:hypothetical protein